MKQDSSRQDPDITKILKGLESHKAEYPEDLLAARRAAFLQQVNQKTQVEIQQEVAPQDQKIAQLFTGLRSVEAAYPERLLAARRSAFKHQILRVQPAVDEHKEVHQVFALADVVLDHLLPGLALAHGALRIAVAR